MKQNFPKPLKTIRNKNMFKILILLFGNVEQRENFIYIYIYKNMSQNNSIIKLELDVSLL